MSTFVTPGRAAAAAGYDEIGEHCHRIEDELAAGADITRAFTDQVLELAQNRWITAHQGILITGPSGSGKSFLAQVLAQHACRSGFSVQYLRLPALLTYHLCTKYRSFGGSFVRDEPVVRLAVRCSAS